MGSRPATSSRSSRHRAGASEKFRVAHTRPKMAGKYSNASKRLAVGGETVSRHETIAAEIACERVTNASAVMSAALSIRF